MSNPTDKFETLLEKTDEYFNARIGEASSRAYEYGVLVVKNAFLVAGGGLFLTPALVQLNKNAELQHAGVAGISFAAAVLLALFANYFIHLNWMFHEKAWEQYWLKDKILLRGSFDRRFADDEERLKEIEKSVEKLNKRINRTFYVPHVLAFVYVALFVFACFKLYQSMGISTL